jgi:hypothetical protein
LQRLTEEAPLSERFSAMFMSALASCNRRVDALAEFRRLRGALISEQGIEPATGIREQHQKLLRDEQVQATAVPRPAMTAIVLPVPRQLPCGAAAFTGRAAEAGELARYLTAADEDGGSPAVAAITGFPGIGKSELAIAVAHRVARNYPDGQLFADLHGSTDSPATPGPVLARFLRALGMDENRIAGDLAEQAAQFRSLVAGRRMLLVLDDVADADQVRPLIPGSPTCGTLVTGRRGLSRLPEARQRTLGGMTDADAYELLGTMAGPERVAREPAAVAAIVAACGAVPLALYAAGARLAARPGWPAAYFADLLADERSRLDELCCGRVSMRAALASAYRALYRADASAASVFRLLAQRQATAITMDEAAVFLGQAPAQVAAALESLADRNLLISPARRPTSSPHWPAPSRWNAPETAPRTASGSRLAHNDLCVTPRRHRAPAGRSPWPHRRRSTHWTSASAAASRSRRR